VEHSYANIYEWFKARGIPVGNLELIHRAFVHSSYSYEKPEEGESNERLEFLGDAVLDLIVSEYLINSFQEAKEGDMTKWRAAVVCELTLAEVARKLGLQSFLLLGKGMQKTALKHSDALLADCMEALIGALYLDQGYNAVQKLLEQHIRYYINQAIKGKLKPDYKTALQEYTQSEYHIVPNYSVIEERGPAHAKEFVVEVSFNGTVWGVADGNSKKEAEQHAAKEAWQKLHLDTII
jgi:ribonuclease-3